MDAYGNVIDEPNDARHMSAATKKEVFRAFGVDPALKFNNATLGPDANTFWNWHVSHVEAMFDLVL